MDRLAVAKSAKTLPPRMSAGASAGKASAPAKSRMSRPLVCMRRCARGKRGNLFCCEEGFSTTGMVVALLVSLSLLFSAAQIYRINSVSADVQNIADAAALAAENEVAEFMVAVRVCDAVAFSLSLTGMAAYGFGIVALCVPNGAALGEKLIELGGKVMDARASFVRTATERLGDYQRALPFLASVNALSVASANDGGPLQARYIAVAVLVPFAGEEIECANAEGMQEFEDSVEGESDALARAAEEAEACALEANEAKLRGFAADCGNDPNYCMYERALSLAGLDGSENPFYGSVDAWSFSVPLKRAQAYYERRLAIEAPADGSVKEGARSALRKRFYQFAVSELERGYVAETPDFFEAYFPLLPKNADEVRQTALYTEEVYPVSSGESGLFVAHAWSGCPCASSVVALASISQMEAGGFEICPACEFEAGSLGQVAAASTAIDNGFEYHYTAVARAAGDYEQARAELDPQVTAVKNQAEGLFAQCAHAFGEVFSQRIDAAPPGRYGAIALVVNMSAASASTGFESSFVHSDGVLGIRAAVSGATLVQDTSEEGRSVVSSLLDGLAEDGGTCVGAARVVLDCWSAMLRGYEDGQNALEDTVARASSFMPLTCASGLGTWAQEAFGSCVSALGLEAVKLDALKPAIVNTGHVASADDGAFSVRFLAAKRQALAGADVASMFSSVLGGMHESLFGEVPEGEGAIEIAVIEIPVGGYSVPLSITLPSAVSDGVEGMIERAVESLRSVFATSSNVRAWE